MSTTDNSTTDGTATTDDKPTGPSEGSDVIEPPADSDQPSIRYHTEPLLTPTLALMGSVALAALLGIGYVWNDPEAVGGPELAELVIYGIIILASLLLIRLSLTLLVLWRTRYTVHDEGFRTEYELAYHSKSREIPVEELRGQERERGRFETLFDCATIRLLTGGTDSSLGFVEFVHVPDPDLASERIDEVKRRHEVLDE